MNYQADEDVFASTMRNAAHVLRGYETGNAR